MVGGTSSKGGNWIQVAQDHVQWRALLLAVLNIRVTDTWPYEKSSSRVAVTYLTCVEEHLVRN